MFEHDAFLAVSILRSTYMFLTIFWFHCTKWHNFLYINYNSRYKTWSYISFWMFLRFLQPECSFIFCLSVSLMKKKKACMEIWICDHPLWLCFLWGCVSAIMWNTLLFFFSSCCCCCVWLCAQPGWLLADNDIRGSVFVDLVVEEIPTVLSVSGLCVFFGVARVTSPAVPLSCWPLNPTRALVPGRHPLLSSEACSSSDKGCTGQTLSGAPQSRSTLTIQPPSHPCSHHLHVKTLGLIFSSLKQWHNSQERECVPLYAWMRGHGRAARQWAKWIVDT